MFTIFNKEIPTNPGVYLMKKGGKIIYVGKAKNLSKRVSSYFNRAHTDEKTKNLVKNIDDIDFIICNSEIDALILENNLIKKYSPKYNINLKDQKSYPYLLITDEEFPRILIVKNLKTLLQKKGRYFGPFPFGAWGLRNILIKLYQIRDCNKDMSKKHSRPCLKFHMKLCNAPCINKNISEEYNQNIESIVEILNGNSKEVIKRLDEEMRFFAEKMAFEKAIFYRERKREIEINIQNQISELRNKKNEDIFCIKNIGYIYFICVLNLVEGKVLGKQFFKIDTHKTIMSENPIEDIILNFYTEFTTPNSLILSSDYQYLKDELTIKFKHLFNKSISLHFPKRATQRKELLAMGEINLDKEIENYYNKKECIEKGLSTLYTRLNLKRVPFRIECFDISNIQGKDAVASMSVTIDGKKAPKHYRKFKIKTKDTPDDFEMMREVINRRYSKLKDNEFPDLILIDGGLGQLNAVGEIFNSLNRDVECDIISIAKKEENIFKLGENTPYIFSFSDEALKILQRLRDEAHRFGVTYHRKLRSKRVISSELDSVKGIGVKRRELLLKRYGSVENIKKQSLEELEKILPKNVALALKELEKEA